VTWEWHFQPEGARTSPALWQMLGILEPKEDPFGHFFECVHPDDRDQVSSAVAEALAGDAVELEFRVVHGDGSVHWLMSRGTTTYDDRGVAIGIVGVNVDVTARKQAEAEIQEQHREVAHLGRVALVGELSIALAHELRQPLAAILLNARTGQRLLAEAPPDLGQLRDILHDIAADDGRAADVITAPACAPRNDAVALEALDANDVVREALQIARPDLAARKVSLDMRQAPRLPSIVADRVQFQQVLLNLVINACEAMDGAPADARRLIVSTAPGPDGFVDITVTDAGSA
jgi:signal transduction histidine kinase